MVSRRLRLVGVALILASCLALLSPRPRYSPTWFGKVPDLDDNHSSDGPESDDTSEPSKSTNLRFDNDPDDTTGKAVDGVAGEFEPDSFTVTTDDASTSTGSPAPSPHKSADEVTKPPPSSQPNNTPEAAETVDWSKFAYSQYVTDTDYLCNSVMIFESLHSLGSKAKRLMMYPVDMLEDTQAKEALTPEQNLLLQARDEYSVELVPINVQHRESSDSKSLYPPLLFSAEPRNTKLLAFNQTSYDRIIALDSDSVVLQSMDELFHMPPCPVAMPRAYWLFDDDPPKRILSSQVILLQPSAVEFERIMAKTQAAGMDDYDMEIVNQLYLDSATVLPHRPYDLLTSEFRAKNHARYLGSDVDEWEPEKALKEAKFLHFSDWPIPKPWIPMTEEDRQKHQPACPEDDENCSARALWNGFYNDFADRRKKICKVLS